MILNTQLVSDWPAIVQILELSCRSSLIACVQDNVQDMRVISLLRSQRYTLDRFSGEEAIFVMCLVLITDP